MDLLKDINNFSYGVTMNGHNDIKIISFNIDFLTLVKSMVTLLCV